MRLRWMRRVLRVIAAAALVWLVLALAIAIFGAPAWLATVGDNEAMASADVEARRGNQP
jgi:hypothetical protein